MIPAKYATKLVSFIFSTVFNDLLYSLLKTSLEAEVCVFCQLSAARSKDASVAMSTPNIQILVSNTIFQLKRPGILGKGADFSLLKNQKIVKKKKATPPQNKNKNTPLKTRWVWQRKTGTK